MSSNKICNSLMVFFVGLCLIPFGAYIVFQNEANEVCTIEAYTEAENIMVEESPWSPTYPTTYLIRPPSPFCGIENPIHHPTGTPFVHITCPVDTTTLSTTEPSTGITVPTAYKLTFLTEQYGYVQTTSSQTGDTTSNTKDTETCYCYKLRWTTSPESRTATPLCDKCRSRIVIPSVPRGGDGPATVLGRVSVHADRVSLGNGTFVIDGGDIDSIAFMPSVRVPSVPRVLPVGGFVRERGVLCNAFGGDTDGCWYSTALRLNGSYYEGYSSGRKKVCSEAPCPGDLRLIVSAYGSQEISALGKEIRYGGGSSSSSSTNAVEPIGIAAGYFGGSRVPPCGVEPVFYLRDGVASSELMFDELFDNLKSLTVTVRLVSWLVVILGFYMLGSPVETVAESIPLLGRCVAPMVGCVLFLFAFCAGTAVWAVAFAFSWTFYRPLLGLAFYAAALLLCWMAFTVQRVSSGRRGVYHAVGEVVGQEETDPPPYAKAVHVTVY